jgi:hypothetical protein
MQLSSSYVQYSPYSPQSIFFPADSFTPMQKQVKFLCNFVSVFA